jgi:hypothetical protein
MFFLASDLNFIFLFISLMCVFDYNSVRTAAEDVEAAAVAIAAAAAEEGGEGEEREEKEGSDKATNNDGDNDSGSIAER